MDFVQLFSSAVSQYGAAGVAIVATCAVVLGIQRYSAKLAFLAPFRTVRGKAILTVLVAAASASLDALGVGSPITVTLLLAGVTAAQFDRIVTGAEEQE